MKNITDRTKEFGSQKSMTELQVQAAEKEVFSHDLGDVASSMSMARQLIQAGARKGGAFTPGANDCDLSLLEDVACWQCDQIGR